MDKSSKKSREPLELLAPAGDLASGLAALSAGADAIYIGAPRFGARAARSVSIEDIRVLSSAAHLYGAKVYAALNTILYDSELQEAERIARSLYAAGCDALIIQDFGLLALDLPPIALHASTQCHNNSVEQLLRLEALGFEQAVLARELSVAETAQLTSALHTLRAETFIHGALCVSYSGRCYLSQAMCGRSANRGECGQMCRMAYDLLDGNGKTIVSDRYLLSLKDLNRSDQLPALIEAGVRSFKIEGRMKGIGYVRNITAYYRQLLDRYITEHDEAFCRASQGDVTLRFSPDPYKSFNRSFTSYQLSKGALPETLIMPESPKSLGEPLGRVTSCRGTRVAINTQKELHNGDGLCYLTEEGKLAGLRVISVQEDKSFLTTEPLALPKGTFIWRNRDVAFDKLLLREDASERKIKVVLRLEASARLLKLSFVVPSVGLVVVVAQHITLDPARQTPREAPLKEALTKLGDTPFLADECHVVLNGFFVPVSLLGDLKRRATEAMARTLRLHYRPQPTERRVTAPLPFPIKEPLDYSFNIANRAAQRTYRLLSANKPLPAFEIEQVRDAALMTTKHCLRRFLGYCTRQGKPMPYAEPLYLRQGVRRFRLSFDCEACLMRLYATD